VDGFRLDLGALLDRETLDAIREEACALFPDVLLLAEPWGGDRYDPHGFSQLEYTVWNDLFRNGVKGWDPQRHTGYIFGHWGASPAEAYGTWVLGSVREKAGPLLAAEHSLNYLESHDGYTLADFIRIATGSVNPGEKVADTDAYRALDARQLAIARFAAFMLFTGAGPLMLHAGQEFGRGKLVADIGVPAVRHGVVDANSYEKDDTTNWLDYRYADDNAALLRYYRGLIAMRASLPALREVRANNCRFLIPDVPVASGYVVVDEAGWPVLAVLANANHDRTAHYQLDDDGPWDVLVDAECAGPAVLRSHVGKTIAVPPCAGMLLRRGA
jgi:pullulanase/glycogen debranching enzyme